MVSNVTLVTGIGAAGHQEAQARMEQGEKLLQAFARRVYERQGVEEVLSERGEQQ